MGGYGGSDPIPKRWSMARLPLLVGAALLVLVGLAVAVGLADRDRDDAWGCAPDRRAYSVGEPAEGGGSPTERDAYVQVVAFVVADGWGGDRYLVALGNRAGPDRLDPETGRLWVNGWLRMEMASPTRLADGTWVVLSYTVCSPPPPAGTSPGPTPSPEPTG